MRLLLCGLLLTAGICSAQIPVTWEVETTRALAKEVEAFQGETLIFRPSFVEYGEAVSTNGLSYSFVWQTNGMGSAWWTTNGTAFRPWMDVGASRYAFFIRAEGTGGVNYRANGTIKLKPSPGVMPNVLPPPNLTVGVNSNDVAGLIGSHNGSGSAHPDIRVQIAGVSNLARSAYNVATGLPTQDDVRDIIAENENGFMIGQDIPYTGGLRAYLVQNDYLFLPKFYYDSDEGVKNWQVGMSSTSIFFANQSSQVTHLKPDGVAYNGNKSIKWPLEESGGETQHTFATREWSAEQAAAHVAAPNPHTNSVAWYLRDLGTNGVLVVVSSNAVFSVFQLKE